MSFYVYILQSQTNGRFYCGYSDDPERRLRQHNDPNYRLSRTTKVIQGPWEIVWLTKCETRSDAMGLEKRVKKRGIERFLEKVPAESRRRRD
jgi:putative endonuclease